MIDELTIDSYYPIPETKLRVPLAMGEVGQRWNNLFGINVGVDQLGIISQEDLLGLAEVMTSYWKDLSEHNDMSQPYWPEAKPVTEIEPWKRAAECLRSGEGDFDSISHLMDFFRSKIGEELKHNPSELVEKRLQEVIVWLADFQKNPRPLPRWQKEPKHGLPVVEGYPTG